MQDPANAEAGPVNKGTFCQPQGPSRMDMTTAEQATISTRLANPPINPRANGTPRLQRRTPDRVCQASRQTAWCFWMSSHISKE